MKLHSFLTLLAAFALTTTLPVDAKADSSAKSSKTKKKKAKSKKKKDKADAKGKSMLESAAESRHQMEKLQLMLAAPGANVKNPRLLEAALKESLRSPGWIEGANLLLGIPGIDTSAVPPILLAVMKNDEAELKRLLKEDGADVNVDRMREAAC